MIRIIGIGSPFGDDGVGLEAARSLSQSPPPNCEIIAADRPGASLIEMIDGADAAILIDAACSGAKPGTLHEFGFGELERCAAAGLVSSHDLGVANAVQLARKLGRAPERGIIIAIEIAPTTRQHPGVLSPAARDAVTRALTRVRRIVSEFNSTSH